MRWILIILFGQRERFFQRIRTMLASLDFDVEMIDDVYVAGGIGSGINMENAVRIGMLPDIPMEKFHYIGNSSLSGAYTMLLSRDAERKCYELASNMTYLELSAVPTYMDEFVHAALFLIQIPLCFHPVYRIKKYVRGENMNFDYAKDSKEQRPYEHYLAAYQGTGSSRNQ